MGRKLSFTGIAAGGGGGGGGGGGTGTFGTVYDEVSFTGGGGGWNCGSSYSSMGRQYGGLKGNQYYFAWMRENSSANGTDQHIRMFSVNRSTGAITDQGSTSAWGHNNGNAVSTTWYTVVEGSGSCVSGGNNAWPGNSSHVFGFDYWQVYNGNVNGGGTSSQDSHNGNGTYNGLCSNSDSIGRNFICGYYQGNNPWGHSNRGAYRKWDSASGAGNQPSVGGRNWPSNPHTSTIYPGHLYPQASNNTSYGTVRQGNSGLASVGCFPIGGSGTYAWYTQDGSGNVTDQFGGTGENGTPHGFQMQDGSVIWKKSSNAAYWYQSNSYTSHTQLDTGSTAYGAQDPCERNQYSYCWAGLSGDYWLTGFKPSSALSWGIPLQIVKITGGNKANGGGSERKHTFTPDYSVYATAADYNQMICPLWENTTDAYPKKLVYMARTGNSGRVVVSDMPDSSDWAT